MKNGYFIGNIHPTFSDKPIYHDFNSTSMGILGELETDLPIGFFGMEAGDSHHAGQHETERLEMQNKKRRQKLVTNASFISFNH